MATRLAMVMASGTAKRRNGAATQPWIGRAEQPRNCPALHGRNFATALQARWQDMFSNTKISGLTALVVDAGSGPWRDWMLRSRPCRGKVARRRRSEVRAVTVGRTTSVADRAEIYRPVRRPPRPRALLRPPRLRSARYAARQSGFIRVHGRLGTRGDRLDAGDGAEAARGARPHRPAGVGLRRFARISAFRTVVAEDLSVGDRAVRDRRRERPSRRMRNEPGTCPTYTSQTIRDSGRHQQRAAEPQGLDPLRHR